MPPITHTAAPGPYDWESVRASHGSRLGQVYLTDSTIDPRTGDHRKIAVVWGSDQEKLATARLLAAAPELYALADRLAPVETAALLARTAPSSGSAPSPALAAPSPALAGEGWGEGGPGPIAPPRPRPAVTPKMRVARAPAAPAPDLAEGAYAHLVSERRR